MVFQLKVCDILVVATLNSVQYIFPMIAAPMGSDLKIPDMLIQLIRVIAQDRKLAVWFLMLGSAPQNARYTELRRLETRIDPDNKHPKLVEAIQLLENPNFFSAAIRLTRDLIARD